MKAKKLAPEAHDAIAIPLLFLCLLGLAAYVNSLHVPFVLDDYASVESNAGVRLGGYFAGPLLWTRSLLFITFALNHKFGGLEVWSYHAVNLMLHLVNGVLVFFIARRVFPNVVSGSSTVTWMSFAAAALFLVHPVQTESVTYISSRSELLSVCFYAIAFLLFISWPEQKIGFLLAALVSILFLLGLGSKETVISLPASFLIYDFLFLSKGSPRQLLRRWRFYSVFLILGVAAVVYLLRQWSELFSPDPLILPPWRYFLTQLRVIARYIQILLFPVGLNLDYDFRPSTSLFEPAVLFCSAGLTALIVAAIHWRRKYPLFAFSILWFFVTLAPTSSFVPIQDVIFEHRLYLPLVGLCLLFPFVFRSRYLASGIIGLFLIGTVYRNNTWGDEVRLYSDIVAKSPEKPRAYNALAQEYDRRGQADLAIATAKAGIAKVPEREKKQIYNVLGNLYVQAGRYDEAIDSYKRSLTEDDSAMAYNNLGVAYLRWWEAVAANTAATTSPAFESEKSRLLQEGQKAFWESYKRDNLNLGSLDSYVNVRYREGNVDDWTAELIHAIQTREDFESDYMLGKIEFNAGNYAEAIKYFEKAAILKGGHKLLHFNLAAALSATNNIQAAIAEYLQAIRIDPTFLEAHFNIALLYVKTADTPKAIEHFGEVLRVDPRNAQTLVQMARLYVQLKNPSRARSYLEEALRLNPQDRQALDLLQRLGS